MDHHTYESIKENLINGGPVAYAIVQMKLHGFLPHLRHYMAAPLPQLTLQRWPLLLRRLTYVDRFDLVVTEQRHNDSAAAATATDALVYLLSATQGQLSEWDSLRPHAAWYALENQGDWLTTGEREQFHRLIKCEPAQPNSRQFNNLQLLQVMLRQWLLQQAYDNLLLRPHYQPFDSDGEYYEIHETALDDMRVSARRRFPAVYENERSNNDPQTTSDPAAPAAAAGAPDQPPPASRPPTWPNRPVAVS